MLFLFWSAKTESINLALRDILGVLGVISNMWTEPTQLLTAPPPIINNYYTYLCFHYLLSCLFLLSKLKPSPPASAVKCTIKTLKTFCHSQKLAYFSVKWFGGTESSSMISELWLVGLKFDPGRPLSESENILFLVNNYCLCQQFLFQCQYPIKYWLRKFVECSTSVKWAFRCHNSDSSLTKSDLLVGK